jgi:transcriptional regulator with XRE-family HTH domain
VKTYDLEFTIRQLISDGTRQYVAEGGKINQLSTKTGLAVSTISKIAYMETQYPRLHTAIALLAALNLTESLARTIQQQSNVIPIATPKEVKR